MSNGTIDIISKVIAILLVLVIFYLSFSNGDNLVICIILALLAGGIRFIAITKYKKEKED